MQNHLRVFPAFVFSRELFPSFKRLGNTLPLKRIGDAAEFTFLRRSLSQGEQRCLHGVSLGKLSGAVLTERPAPLGRALQRAPRGALGAQGTQSTHLQLHRPLVEIYIPGVIFALW